MVSVAGGENGFRPLIGYAELTAQSAAAFSTEAVTLSMQQHSFFHPGGAVGRVDRVPGPHFSSRFVAALLLGSLACGCASSLPLLAGPTTLAGMLPAPTIGATATAERASGTSDGPLRLLAPLFRWRHASSTAAVYTWECTVENPSHSVFEVTVVVEVLDENGAPLATKSQSFRLGGGDKMPISGEGLLEGDLAPRVTSWRLGYWVQAPPPPSPDQPELHSHSIVPGGLVEMS
ncbi:MAG: hypothetical protein ACE5HV_01675 [Acidobacteriota bacterium]